MQAYRDDDAPVNTGWALLRHCTSFTEVTNYFFMLVTDTLFSLIVQCQMV